MPNKTVMSRRRPPTPPSPTPPSHPIQPFHLPQTPLEGILSLPSRLGFAFAGLFGLAHFARQVVSVQPRHPGVITLRHRGDDDDDREVLIVDWMQTNVPSLRIPYVPTWWLPNGHLQLIYSVLGDFTKVDEVRYVRKYLRVPDGGTIGLDFTPPHHESLPGDTPTMVICHGLTGGSHESYVRNVLVPLVKPKSEGGLGLRAVVVNSRGCAGVPVTSPQFYSAGTTLDLAITLHYLRSTYPNSSLHGMGFSLGAAVLSRYLGESSSLSLLSSGIAFAAPWDLPSMSTTLETHWWNSKMYSAGMGKNLLDLFFRHYNANPMTFDRDGAATKEWVPKLKEMYKNGRGKGVRLKMVDDVMVSRFGGPRGIGLWPFDGADEYYAWANPKNVVGGVKRPLLVLNSFDDPIVDGAVLPIDEFQASSHLYAAITGGGGHLGWYTGARAQARWHQKPAVEFMRAAVRDLPISGGPIEVETKPKEEGFTNGVYKTAHAANGNGAEHGVGVGVGKEKNPWVWVKQPAHEVSGVGDAEGGGGGRVGWRVLDEGEIVKGEAGGSLQGF